MHTSAYLKKQLEQLELERDPIEQPSLQGNLLQ